MPDQPGFSPFLSSHWRRKAISHSWAKAALVLSDEEPAQLQSIAWSRSLPAALVRRADMVLACAAGATNSAVARRFGTANATVGKWRRRFVARRIEGLHDELRPGKPRSIDDERIAALLDTTLHARPKDGASHWSVRGLAAETGIAKTSVHRFLQAFGLQPHRRDSCKLSTDPFFIEKLRDVVGLYLSPPDKALVLCLDEKSPIQALARTQPLLPLGFGYVEGVTHDYLRHGTTTLFAALDLLDGTVLARCRPRHRHQEFLNFLRAIDQAVPADLEIHAILDNYATHKHPKVKAWLAARPRWHLHFIPTDRSWLNLVERFFAPISDKALRRGSFPSVRDLVATIDHFVTHDNQTCKRFVWTATADSILAKLERLCARINRTQ
jgi:putative transposase